MNNVWMNNIPHIHSHIHSSEKEHVDLEIVYTSDEKHVNLEIVYTSDEVWP